jgi:cytochrome c-type biogenesis protein CcmH
MRSILLALWLLLAAAAQDQGASAVLIDGLEPGPPPPASSVDVTAHQLGKLLRCPVCQGLSIADSNAEGALMIQNRIEELVAAGYGKEQILDYFVSKYGEWILLEPPPEGLNLLIWLGPLGALSIGLIAIVSQYRRQDPVSQSAAEPPPSTDRYEAQLLKELDDDF